MIKIKRISNEDKIHFFKFNIKPNIHTKIIEFLHSLDFPESEIIKIDTPFSELEGEYLFVKKENIKIHFFITKKEVNMIIDTPIVQKELVTMMKNYFELPSQLKKEEKKK